MLPLFNMIGGDGRGKATVTLTDNTVITTDLTAYTFSTQSLGTAASNRRIIVTAVAAGIGAQAISSLTVAGVSAINVIAVPSGSTEAEIWIADVPTGTTGDVVVTWGGEREKCGIGVFRAVGLRPPVRATASSTADPMSASLFIPTDGIAVGVGADNSISTYTWTNLTERFDELIEGSTNHTGASVDNATAQTPTITCDPSNVAVVSAMALASWEPE